MTKPSKLPINDIINQYKLGKSTVEIANEFDTYHAAISRILHKNNVRIRDRSSACRKLQLNEKVFDDINEHSSYWIGFIITDGCVYHNRIRIGLKLSDIDHLKSFREFLQSTHKISIVNNQGFGNQKFKACVFEFRSNYMVNRLREYGIVPNKSKKVIVKKLFYNKDFWRGAIDGDGWINTQITKYNKSMPYLGFCSASYDFIYQFKQFVEYNFPTFVNKIRNNGTTFQLIYGGLTSARIINLLYYNNAISLNRKNNRAVKIISHYQEKNKLDKGFLTHKEIMS